MTSVLRKSLFVLATAGASMLAQAATLRVPQQYASIQAAIDAAADGDIIRVAAGTYTENLQSEGKSFSLLGAGAQTTIIDGGALGPVMAVAEVATGPITVAGFTIRNGLGSAVFANFGGGIHAVDVHLVVRDNVLTGNSACSGMAIWMVNGSIKLIRNRIHANIAPSGCGHEALFLIPETDSVIDHNVIADHNASGVHLNSLAKVSVRHNVFRDNHENLATAARGWGGFGAYNAELVLEDNLFANNSGSLVGAAFLTSPENGEPGIARNNSFVGNSGSLAAAILYGGAGGPLLNLTLTSNLFNDDNGVTEIECQGNPVPINEKSQVFASESTPPYLSSCPTGD
jgi:hypothetical protein